MVVGPGNEPAAGASGGQAHLRASHADRDQVIDMLKAAFVQGQLAKDEFDSRVGQVLASRTYGGLQALTADLPARLARAQPPGPAREPVDTPAWEAAESKIVKVFAGLIVAAPSTVFGLALMESQSRPELSMATRVFLIVVLAFTLTVPASGLVLLHSWLQNRSAGDPSQGPPPNGGGHASQREASADPSGQFPRITHDPRHTAQAEGSRRRAVWA